jgi:uncharacterized protein YecT (DUF1311 family)
MKLHVGLACILLAITGAAAAQALDECYRAAPPGAPRAALTPCLDAARKQATDRMLEAFLAAQKSMQQLDAATGRSLGVDALKQSQREFERYLRAQCNLVQVAYASGTGAGQAGLGCEVDQLRARAAALEVLKPAAQAPAKK